LSLEASFSDFPWCVAAEGHELLGNGDGLARPRIATLPGRPVLHRKGAESAQLHPVPARQGLDDLVEHHFHYSLHVAVIKMWIRIRDFVDQLGLDHHRPRSKYL